MTPVAPSGGEEIVVWNGTLAPGASGSSVTDTVQVWISLLFPSRNATRSFGTALGLLDTLATWPLIASVGVPFSTPRDGVTWRNSSPWPGTTGPNPTIV